MEVDNLELELQEVESHPTWSCIPLEERQFELALQATLIHTFLLDSNKIFSS